MPEERREQVTRVGIYQSQRATGGLADRDGRRQPSMGGTSRMNREVQVRNLRAARGATPRADSPRWCNPAGLLTRGPREGTDI